MPLYRYRALKGDGQVVEATLEAPHVGVVMERLDSGGYLPLQIKEVKSPSSSSPFGRKVKPEEIVLFTKQLVTLLKAGIPLLSALEALAEQTANEYMRRIIQDIYVTIEGGVNFSEALSKHADVFPPIYINSIRAGELSGSLDEVLGRMATMLEHEKETRAKIRTALRYPIIVVLALGVAIIVLITLVVPKFASMFQQLGAQLPLPTRLLIGMNEVFRRYWMYLIGGGVALFLGFRRYIKTEKGRYQWDSLKLKLPIVGPLVLKTSLSRFAKMFETLNRSGLPILQTLNIVSKTVGNVVIGQEILQIARGVEKGEGIAQPLRRSKLFPPMIVRMIAVGEQSGSLDDMLSNISTHYDLEVDYAIKSLTSMIEPVLTATLGVFILFLALAIFLPMWNMMGLLR